MLNRKLDLRGVKCPTNYVKAKLALEEMEAGGTLALLLSDGEPIINVPRSIKEDGNKILEVKELPEGGFLCRILKV